VRRLSIRNAALWGPTLITLMCCASLHSQASSRTAYNESLVRAAVIFGILRFTQWPEGQVDSHEVALCSYGDSASSRAIAGLEKLPSIGQTKVVYRDDVNSVDGCHAVIIGKGKSLLAPQAPTLLICDDCDVATASKASITLNRIESRIQFEINLDRVDEQRLSLSSSLIELAASCSSTNPAIRGCDD